MDKEVNCVKIDIDEPYVLIVCSGCDCNKCRLGHNYLDLCARLTKAEERNELDLKIIQ